MMNRILLLLTALFSVALLSAQVAHLKALEKGYNWKGQPVLDASIPPLVATEGADILSEKQRVTFLRSKPEMLTVVFERHVVFRFGTREAIEKHSRFRLPESFDPHTDYQDVAIKDRDSIPRPLLFEVGLESFAGRVIGPEERAHEIEPKGKIFYQRKKMGFRFFRAATFDLELPGIAPGDTVEVIYKYTVPFRDNWFRFNSSKHYFHGDLFKHHYRLQVDATRMQGLNLRGAPADSTSLTKKKRYAYWFLEDLPACMDEINARPARDLPHVVYGTAMDSELYQHGHVVSASLGGLPYAYSNVPYWVTLLRAREDVALGYRRLARKKNPIGQQSRVRNWLIGFGGIERSPLEKALMVHDRIANEFEFQWDDPWFDNIDQSLIKHGDLIEEKTLREIGRYSQYSKILAELKLKYHTVYVQDKRAGELQKDELTDLVDNEFLFMLRSGDGAYFLHPKRARGGYLVNEKPFYWEGTKALVGNLDKLWSNADKMVELIDLPRMNPLANRRAISTQVMVSETGNLDYRSQILLNGQFSTMMRNIYLYGERDSIVSPIYGRMYLQEKTGFAHELLSGPSKAPPYTTEFLVNATETTSMSMSADSLIVLNLSDLFPFIKPEGLNAASRDLPFYWDFEHQDRFRVDITLPFDVKITEAKNEFGSEGLGTVLLVDIKQLSARNLSVSAVLRVDKERVPVHHIEHLKDVFDQVDRLNRMNIVLKRVEEK